MIEEMLHLLSKRKWPSSLKGNVSSELEPVAERIKKMEVGLQQLLDKLVAFQKVQSERIFSMVLTYMPQDFRLTYLKQYRERSEKKKQAEVDNLMASGGSIHDKYVLLWSQQMERRRQLAQLGSATGVFRTLVKYLVGCPQVLLEFVCKINDDHGPMEEQRERYGPSLYKLTTFAVALRVFLAVWWSAFDCEDISREEMLEVLEQSVEAYKFDFTRYLDFMQEVFKNSPFFITPEEAGIAASADQDYKEATIAAGKTHEVILPVKYEGALVAWDFRLTSGKDIGFSVELVDSSRATRPMFPYQRYETHQGSFQSPCVGNYRLVWDNTYSNFYRKYLRYKVDEIPPVLEEAVIEGTEVSTSSDSTLT
ncbi:uncharacterized protein [Physcomitrium patens]|nr:uncharacterized protein LOC112284007 isoform X2 [Physcomitrium patens]|eukprot:XP_024379220.1 uncharacterized protein LOC112284007 isoform X2 [Physcomitrella patens]